MAGIASETWSRLCVGHLAGHAGRVNINGKEGSEITDASGQLCPASAVDDLLARSGASSHKSEERERAPGPEQWAQGYRKWMRGLEAAYLDLYGGVVRRFGTEMGGGGVVGKV